MSESSSGDRSTGRKKSSGSGGSARSTAGSQGSSPSGPNALGLEQPPPFEPPPEPEPAELAHDVAYEPPLPEPLEWTPERAGNLVRAGGFLLHNADSLSREPEGEELWRATQADVEEIGLPLARILNRYAPARRLAGVSDEVEFGMAMMAYARRNLALRGRVVKAKKERDTLATAPGWGPDAPPPAPLTDVG